MKKQTREGLVTASIPVVALALASCSASVSVHLRTGEDCTRDFGSSTAAQKIETYLSASAALPRATNELVSMLEAACRDGLAEAGVVEAGTTPSEADACEALAGWIATESAELAAPPSLAPDPEARCRPSRDAFADCMSRCELRYRAEDVRVVEEEQELLGAPEMSPRCRASCGTLSAIESTCAPRVRVEASSSAEGGADDATRVERLSRVLEHAARAIDAGDRAHRLSMAASRLVAIAPVLPEAAATVSIRAVACVGAAREPVQDAAERLERAHERTGSLRRRMRADVQVR